MRNLIFVLFALVGFMSQAQTFNFSCFTVPDGFIYNKDAQQITHIDSEIYFSYVGDDYIDDGDVFDGDDNAIEEWSGGTLEETYAFIISTTITVFHERQALLLFNALADSANPPAETQELMFSSYDGTVSSEITVTSYMGMIYRIVGTSTDGDKGFTLMVNNEGAFTLSTDVTQVNNGSFTDVYQALVTILGLANFGEYADDLISSDQQSDLMAGLSYIASQPLQVNSGKGIGSAGKRVESTLSNTANSDDFIIIARNAALGLIVSSEETNCDLEGLSGLKLYNTGNNNYSVELLGTNPRQYLNDRPLAGIVSSDGTVYDSSIFSHVAPSVVLSIDGSTVPVCTPPTPTEQRYSDILDAFNNPVETAKKDYAAGIVRYHHLFGDFFVQIVIQYAGNQRVRIIHATTDEILTFGSANENTSFPAINIVAGGTTGQSADWTFQPAGNLYPATWDADSSDEYVIDLSAITQGLSDLGAGNIYGAFNFAVTYYGD